MLTKYFSLRFNHSLNYGAGGKSPKNSTTTNTFPLFISFTGELSKIPRTGNGNEPSAVEGATETITLAIVTPSSLDDEATFSPLFASGNVAKWNGKAKLEISSTENRSGLSAIKVTK